MGCVDPWCVTPQVFYPSYGMVKSEKIPEEIRSAVMNIFRIPLNAFVVLLLLKIKYLSSFIVFSICTAAHGVAFLCYLYFYLSARNLNLQSSADKSEGKNGVPYDDDSSNKI